LTHTVRCRCRYYEVKLTSQKTTVQEETVQVNTEDDQRRKDVEQRTRDVVTSDSDYSKSMIRRDDLVSTTTTESSLLQTAPKKDVREDTDKEWRDRRDVQTDVTTITTTTESSRSQSSHAGEEWSQSGGRDESDSAFHKYQTGGSGGYGSSTEESWELRSGRSSKRDTMLRIQERTGKLSPSPVSPLSPASPSSLRGGMRSQAVDSEQLNVCSHEEKRRFYIRAVVDPRNGLHLSIKEVISFKAGRTR